MNDIKQRIIEIIKGHANNHNEPEALYVPEFAFDSLAENIAESLELPPPLQTCEKFSSKYEINPEFKDLFEGELSAEEVMRKYFLTKDNYSNEGGSYFTVENIKAAMEEYHNQGQAVLPISDGQIKVLENIMSDFGEAHNMLAKTKLDSKEYNPISHKLAEAKIQLFNFYNTLKNSNPVLIRDEDIEKEVAYKEYIKLLEDEINEFIPFAAEHNWKPAINKHERGKQLREIIAKSYVKH